MYAVNVFKLLHTMYVVMSKMKIELEGYATIDKVAKKSGRGTGIYLPIEWENKKVRAILLEPIEDK
jgi:hypothetical protein